MTAYTLDMARCDDTPDNPRGYEARLRSLAVVLAYAVTFKWLLARVAMLAVHVADVLARLLRGPTSVLLPSRTGGGDHSLHAILSGRSPMCKLGGGFTDGAECHPPTRRVPIVRDVMTRAGWVVVRRWRLVRVHVRLTGVVACFDPLAGASTCDAWGRRPA